MAHTELKDKRVLVLGLGRFGGGVDAAAYAARKGADVWVVDQASADALADSMAQLQDYLTISFHLGRQDEADVDWADILLINPAIPDSHALVQHAKNQGKVITNSVNLFFQGCPAPIIGITGANGKSTTAALTAHLLQTLPGRQVWLSGNIGHQPLLESLEQISPEDLVVLELSSFQTERLAEIQKGPQVALLTNLTPNHLDRHGTFAAYCEAKEIMFRYQPCKSSQSSLSLFWDGDPLGQQWFDRYQYDAGRTCRLYRVEDVPTALREAYRLPGQANLQNLAGAWAVAQHFGVVEADAVRVLPIFKSLAHRLEWVAEVEGVQWFNDSIATTPESTLVALEAFTQPKIVIAGGYDKGISFAALGQALAQQTKAVVLIGQTAPQLAEAVRSMESCTTTVFLVNSLEEAVKCAHLQAQTGDVVLLSPACASYDMFTHFQQRGETFKKHVFALGSQ